MKLTLLTLCEQAIISRQNKLSIIGITDKLFVKKLPGFYSLIRIAAISEGAANKAYEFDLVITDSKANKLINRKVTTKTGLNGKADIILNLRNLKLLSTGQHKLEFFYHKKSLGKLNFDVILVTDNKQTKLERNYLPN